MKGKIIRGIAGFYYVNVPELGILECKAKGAFRNLKVKPLVGDDVLVELLDREKGTGNIREILDRRNKLIRPAVANVDQAAIIFAISYPKPNFNLLDRFLLMMGYQGVRTVICFNKTDDAMQGTVEELAGQYGKCGCELYFTSTVTGEGIEGFKECLRGKTTVFAGPSGVGKSSVMNALFSEVVMETGEISEKIKRGKHTTRHSELFYLGELGKDTYALDTPGFTSLELPDLEKEDIKEYYPEFLPWQGSCRFQGCVHINEPDCQVKEALEECKISRRRYENYRQFYEELRVKKKY